MAEHVPAGRAAVIDIGSNTVHLLVAESDAGQLKPVRDATVRTALGVAVAASGAAGTAGTAVVADAVKRLAAAARDDGAGEVLLLGTHAVRAATDRSALTAAVEAAAGALLRVLTPDQEARLCLAGAALGALPPPPFLLADIGGGSCDLVIVDADGVQATASVACGSGVLASRYLASDPPPAEQVQAADGAVRDELAHVLVDRPHTFPAVVATGGAARRLSRQAGEMAQTADLLRVIDRVLHEPRARWPRPVSDRDRAAITRAGAVILRAVVKYWHVPRWQVSSHGLREGALWYRARGWDLDTVPESPVSPTRLPGGTDR